MISLWKIPKWRDFRPEFSTLQAAAIRNFPDFGLRMLGMLPYSLVAHSEVDFTGKNMCMYIYIYMVIQWDIIGFYGVFLKWWFNGIS